MPSISKLTVPNIVSGNLVFSMGMWDFGANNGPKRQPFANFCTDTICKPSSFSYTRNPFGTDDRDRLSIDVSFT